MMLAVALLIETSGIAGAAEKVAMVPIATRQATGNDSSKEDASKTEADSQSDQVSVTEVVVKEQKDSKKKNRYTTVPRNRRVLPLLKR